VLKTRKRFGQHFLHDSGVLRRIVDAVNPARDDAVVEIGPGEGALTRPLLERLDRLTAVEIDRDLAAKLAAEFPADRLRVVQADALECAQSLLLRKPLVRAGLRRPQERAERAFVLEPEARTDERVLERSQLGEDGRRLLRADDSLEHARARGTGQLGSVHAHRPLVG